MCKFTVFLTLEFYFAFFTLLIMSPFISWLILLFLCRSSTYLKGYYSLAKSYKLNCFHWMRFQPPHPFFPSFNTSKSDSNVDMFISGRRETIATYQLWRHRRCLFYPQFRKRIKCIARLWPPKLSATPNYINARDLFGEFNLSCGLKKAPIVARP